MTDQPSSAAPNPAPAAPAAPSEASSAVPGLTEKLGTLVRDPALAPLPEPTGSALTDETVGQIYREYQATPGDDQAFGLLLRKSVDLAKAAVTSETVKRENSARASRALSSIHAEITEAVKRTAPDVDVDLFWGYGARQAERECPASIADPIARLNWQAARAIALVREKTGSRPRSTGTPSRGARPGVRTMVEQMADHQRRFFGPNAR